ncbi:uncharacterized protein BX663DRAFT_524614 [Cokeromyces recurvatus]|uniref:uncharacterized protein n=1 Tax=Cokeromyces recurvatus TaxID=90255 RepID=UPI00221FCDD7|nr:uncharacterized protein BX663DRAFT_524614 [Cokeromyces recurvatus]KAI7898565.1 hypothetical protein BX663DRAFT_524614 [Cokeromyces recurvatus]
MAISIHLPKFIKKTFSTHKEEEDSSENSKSTPVTSNASTPAGSVYQLPIMAPTSLTVGCPGYIRDPMRCGNHPDIVGYYYDPMGCKFSLDHGVDTTNTGA